MEFKKFHHERFKEQKYWDSVRATLDGVIRTGKFKQGYLIDSIHSLSIRNMCRFLTEDTKLYPPVLSEKADEMFLEKVSDQIDMKMFGLSALAVTSFLIKKGKTYVIAKDFFTKFREVSLGAVKADRLPKDFWGYLELPYPVKRVEQHDEPNVVGLYFAILRQGFYDKIPVPEDWLIIVPINSNGCLTSSICANLNSTQTLEESLATVPNPEFVRLCLNLIVYIYSGDPDIRQYRNVITYQSKTSKTPIRAHKELSQEIIHLVGYNWKKPVIVNYEAISWDREGHFRWQHYGQDRALIKLIWICPTICTRKNNSTTNQSTYQSIPIT